MPPETLDYFCVRRSDAQVYRLVTLDLTKTLTNVRLWRILVFPNCYKNYPPVFIFKAISKEPKSLSLQGEFYSCPPQISLKFSGLQDSGMGRYPSPKLAADIHFYFWK